MNVKEKRRRRKIERKRQKQFVQKTVKLSLTAALILCVLIVIMVPIVPKMLSGRIDRAIEARNFERAEKTASLMGAETMAVVRQRINYRQAEDLMDEGHFDRARGEFLALGDYSDAAQRAQEAIFRKGNALIEEGDDAQALNEFLSVSGYPGALELANACRYRLAQRAYQAGDLIDAFRGFEALGEYEDARDRAARIAMEVTGESDAVAAMTRMTGYSEEEMAVMERMGEIMGLLRPGWIDVGYRHTVAITAEGRALAAGDNADGQLNVENWTEITKICAGAYHTVGLRADGTVVATGRNDNGECNVSKWTNVVDIAVGASDTYALTADGAVLHTGFTAKTAATGWTGVQSLAAGSYAAAALYGNGEMLSTSAECLLQDCGALIDMDVSTGYGVGILRTGTVVSTFGEIDWPGTVAISASGAGFIGIDVEGRVRARFFRSAAPYGFDDVPQRAVAVAMGGAHSAVLYEDGTVRVYGNNDWGQADVNGWKLF